MVRIGAFLVAGALALASSVGPAAADDRAEETAYVLGVLGPDTVSGGDEVTLRLTATDQEGSHVSGLLVRFVSTGPGPETWESCSAQRPTACTVTADGQADATFGVGLSTGVLEVRAEVYSPEGMLLAEVGPEEIRVISLSCSLARGKCTPLRALLRAGDSKPRRDVLKVESPTVWRNSRVVLMRRTSGTWAATGRLARLGPTGDCSFSVPDRNGRAVTKYKALILPRTGSMGDTTPVVRLR
jgi:hypothetical protein